MGLACTRYRRLNRTVNSLYMKSLTAGAALEGSRKLAIPQKFYNQWCELETNHSSVKIFSNRSNLINECIIICRGLVCPSVRVLVTVRLLREFGWSRGRCGGIFRGGDLIKIWHKVSVYTALYVCACIQRFKKKREARCLVVIFHNLKSNLLSISCSHANPIDFSLGLPKLDKIHLFNKIFLFLPVL